jgi:hypothetical protein
MNAPKPEIRLARIGAAVKRAQRSSQTKSPAKRRRGFKGALAVEPQRLVPRTPTRSRLVPTVVGSRAGERRCTLDTTSLQKSKTPRRWGRASRAAVKSPHNEVAKKPAPTKRKMPASGKGLAGKEGVVSLSLGGEWSDKPICITCSQELQAPCCVVDIRVVGSRYVNWKGRQANARLCLHRRAS